jgi:predicted aconitase with swiveling domain
MYGPVSDVSINHLRIRNTFRPTERAGDCVRLVGEAAGAVSHVDIGDVLFAECDRSGLAVQRAVSFVTLHNSIFKRGTVKTAIDFEPTGPVGVGGDSDFSIGNNVFGSGVSLAGQPAPDMTTDITFSGNEVHGRLGVMNAARVSLTGNVIAYVADDAEAALSIKASEGIVVSGNIVRRLVGSTPGPVFKSNGSNGKFPTGILIDGNIFKNEVEGNPVELESVQKVTLSDNEISGSGAFSGIFAKATGRDLDHLLIRGNRVSGTLNGISLTGGPGSVGVVTVQGNPETTLHCENPSKFAKPVSHDMGAGTGCK